MSKSSAVTTGLSLSGSSIAAHCRSVRDERQLNSFRRHHGGLLPPDLIYLIATRDIKDGEELTIDYEPLLRPKPEILSSVPLASLFYP